MFTEIAHLPKLLSISSSIVEIFLSIRICGFQMPITSKFDFSQVGDPKGVHQGYHEMTYTKFGRGRSFCKNEVGGGGGPGGVIFLFSEFTKEWMGGGYKNPCLQYCPLFKEQ